MYLGIDLGTSAVKVCVLRDDGTLAATSQTALTSQQPFSGASEQNCADWWQATCQAIGSIDPGIRRDVRAIGLSGQMHGAVLLDADKAPLRPAILWNDGRATTECEDIVRAEPQAGVIGGVMPMSGFTAPKLLWMSRHEPETHRRIAHILLPKDYIGLRLHGGLVTDPSDAAGTCWFDQQERAWSPRMGDVTATQLDWLPQVRSGTEVAGTLLASVADDLGLSPGIAVVAGAGDAAAGAVGIGAVEAGDAFLSLGTSGQLFVATDHYKPNPDSAIHSYAHTVPDMWFQMAAMLNGARPLAWLAELLGRPIDTLLADAEQAETGPLFLPYLTGERTPHGDSAIRGGFAMLDEATSPASLMRSAVEAVAFTFADAFQALASVGAAPDTALAIGGGTRSDFLLQTIADVTGCRLGRTKGADIGPAVGAAKLAAVAVDVDRLSWLAQKPPVERWFEPRPSERERLHARLAAYRAFYPALKSVQQTL